MGNNNITLDNTKVLIINATSMFGATAEAITIKSIFSVVPENNLMEFSFRAPEGNSVHVSSYSISRHKSFIRMLSERKFAKRINSEIKDYEIADYESSQKPKVSFVSNLRQYIAISISNSGFYISRKQHKLIKEFNPDVIYTTAANLAVMKIVNKLSKKYKIHIIPHFMDNWQEALEWSNNPFLKKYKRKIDINVAKMYKHSKYAFGISSRMAKVYEERWGIPHSYLMNAVDLEKFHCEGKLISNKVSMLYAGGLHLNRWKSLLEICKLFPIIEQKTGKKYFLDVFCPEKDQIYSSFFDERYVLFHKPVPHDDIKKLFEKSDILLHIETEMLLNDKYAKYSLTTKLPEYLSSGRRFFYYGPEQLFLTQYLIDSELCLVCYSHDELLNKLIYASGNDIEMNRYISCASKEVVENFSLVVARQRLNLAIQETIGENK